MRENAWGKFPNKYRQQQQRIYKNIKKNIVNAWFGLFV